MIKKKEDRKWMAIWWTTMMGIGVGFVFLQTSPLYFVASIMIWIGLGLVVSVFIKD